MDSPLPQNCSQGSTSSDEETSFRFEEIMATPPTVTNKNLEVFIPFAEQHEHLCIDWQFQLTRGQENLEHPQKDHDQEVHKGSRPFGAAELATETEVLGAFSFTLNFNGLDERNLMQRIENIVSITKAEQADIVFLQEVVHLPIGEITRALPQYEVIMQASCEEYFVMTLLKKDTVRVISRRDESFANSVMGCWVLNTEVDLGGTKLWLQNTRLEITGDFKDARVQQLKLLFCNLPIHSNTHSTILAGDTNLRDAEVRLAGGIPGNSVDVWEAFGPREE